MDTDIQVYTVVTKIGPPERPLGYSQVQNANARYI